MSFLTKVLGIDKLVKSNTAKNLSRVFSTSFRDFTANQSSNIYDIDTIRSIFHRVATDAAQFRFKHQIINENGISDKRGRINFLLNVRPNARMSSFDFVYNVVTNLLIDSNAFVHAQYDNSGKLAALIPINYKTVTVLKAANNDLYLEFYLEDLTKIIFSYDSIIHLRRYFKGSFLGSRADTVISHASKVVFESNIAIINSLQQSGKLNAVIAYEGTIKEADLEKRQKNFAKRFMSQANASGIGAIDGGGKFNELKGNYNLLNEGQLDFFKEIMYNFYNIATPIVSGDFTEAQYNAYLSSMLQPLATQISVEMTYKLFTQRELDVGNKITVDTKKLWFASTASKATYFKDGLKYGWLSQNDIRDIEEMSRIDGGDVYRVDLNSVDNRLASIYQLAKAKALFNTSEGENALLDAFNEALDGGNLEEILAEKIKEILNIPKEEE